MMSTWDDPEQLRACQQLGCKAFLRKPVKLPEIQAVLTEVFGASSAA
jgi:CheY-like chemotaxis protein